MRYFRPYTDFITSTEDEAGLSGPEELPYEADQPDSLQNADVGGVQTSPVLAESDNFLIEQSENECKKVRPESAIRRQASNYAVFSIRYF